MKSIVATNTNAALIMMTFSECVRPMEDPPCVNALKHRAKSRHVKGKLVLQCEMREPALPYSQAYSSDFI